MKKTAIVLTLVLICKLGISQTQDTNYCKLSIGIIGSTSIYIGGADKFFGDRWYIFSIKNPTEQKRRNYKYGYGVKIQYFFNERLSLKGIFGISQRHIIDRSLTINGTTTLIDNYQYKQTSYNIMVGLNLSFNIKRFVFNSGLELAYLRTGVGNEKEVYEDINDSPPDILDSSNITINTKISPGNSYGLGLNLGIEYNITKHFSIGAEFHEFAFYSVFNNNTSINSKHYSSSYYSPDLIITQSETNVNNKEDFGQFSFSTILPVLTINYKFNCR
jgi:hypothetical protein